MQILAFPSVRATSSCEEQTAVFVPCGIRACEAGVFADIAAGLGLRLTGDGVLVITRGRYEEDVDILGVAILPISSRPFIIPYIYTIRKFKSQYNQLFYTHYILCPSGVFLSSQRLPVSPAFEQV